MAAVKLLALDILARHPVPTARVLGHSDVAPLRKDDPGELFDWRGLAAAGIGLWPETGSSAVLESAVGKALARVGYSYTDENLPAVIRAFQRHFRPGSITGNADPEARKSGVSGKSGSVRVDLGGRRRIKKKTTNKTNEN